MLAVATKIPESVKQEVDDATEDHDSTDHNSEAPTELAQTAPKASRVPSMPASAEHDGVVDVKLNSELQLSSLLEASDPKESTVTPKTSDEVSWVPAEGQPAAVAAEPVDYNGDASKTIVVATKKLEDTAVEPKTSDEVN